MVAIQWGVVGDVGFVIDEIGRNNETIIGGTVPQRMASCLNVLDTLLQQPDAILVSMVVATKTQASEDEEIVDAALPKYSVRPFFPSIHMEFSVSL